MPDDELDLRAAKVLVAEWISGLSVTDPSFPSSVTNILLDQLDKATPVPDREGILCLEIPALVSLGSGIFRCSFRVKGIQVRVVPYAPTDGLPRPSSRASAIPRLALDPRKGSGPVRG
jgi:hypothetical protein